MDLLALIEIRLRENTSARERLTREATLLRRAATRLRTGERPGPVAAQLWADGVDLTEDVVVEDRRR